MSKIVDITSTDQLTALLKSSKVVLVDFWAEWCGPCKVIAPTFEKLSEKWSRANVITFAKVDNDKQQTLVEKYEVRGLPTIILFENGKETQRMKGGDISSLIKITERFTEITTKGGASGSGGVWIGAPFPRGYGDISNQIEMQGIDLLNADPDFAPARTLFGESEPTGATYSSEGKGKAAETSSKGDTDWIESDTDSQLMLYIPFQGTQKVHSIHITSFARRTPDDDDDEIPARPKRVDLFINRSHNLGFEEAEDIPATQSVELSPESWNPKTKTAVIETRFVKFQHVSSLVIFVVDAEGDGERTRVDRIRIVGESGEKRMPGKLQKIGDDEP